MNPKLVEEVIFLICEAEGIPQKNRDPDGRQMRRVRKIAAAAIRVCMARAAKIALNHEASAEDYDGTYRDGCEAAADAIKREGGVT